VQDSWDDTGIVAWPEVATRIHSETDLPYLWAVEIIASICRMLVDEALGTLRTNPILSL
jgi:hypothetical protein